MLAYSTVRYLTIFGKRRFLAWAMSLVDLLFNIQPPVSLKVQTPGSFLNVSECSLGGSSKQPFSSSGVKRPAVLRGFRLAAIR